MDNKRCSDKCLYFCFIRCIIPESIDDDIVSCILGMLTSSRDRCYVRCMRISNKSLPGITMGVENARRSRQSHMFAMGSRVMGRTACARKTCIVVAKLCLVCSSPLYIVFNWQGSCHGKYRTPIIVEISSCGTCQHCISSIEMNIAL